MPESLDGHTWTGDYMVVTAGFTEEQHDAISRLFKSANRAGRFQAEQWNSKSESVNAYDAPGMYYLEPTP